MSSGTFMPPTSSSTTSAPPSSRTRANASGPLSASTPSAATFARTDSLRTLAITVTSIERAICTAAVPTPPLAPFTSSTSPARRPDCETIASYAVR